MFDFNFIPVLGLTGSGKSAFLESRQLDGGQVVSVEFIAGVTGVCLRNLHDTVIAPAHFEAALLNLLGTFDKAVPVYVEWKPELVHRVCIPVWFTDAIRASTVFVLLEPFEVRVRRLLCQYAPLVDHLDYLVTVFESSGVLRDADLRLLRGYQVANDAPGMVRFLLQAYFDPLYVREIKLFQSLAYGRFDGPDGAFLGSVASLPFDFESFVMDGYLSEEAILHPC